VKLLLVDIQEDIGLTWDMIIIEIPIGALIMVMDTQLEGGINIPLLPHGILAPTVEL
jgi:hypothetical protein